MRGKRSNHHSKATDRPLFVAVRECHASYETFHDCPNRQRRHGASKRRGTERPPYQNSCKALYFSWVSNGWVFSWCCVTQLGNAIQVMGEYEKSVTYWWDVIRRRQAVSWIKVAKKEKTILGSELCILNLLMDYHSLTNKNRNYLFLFCNVAMSCWVYRIRQSDGQM